MAQSSLHHDKDGLLVGYLDGGWLDGRLLDGWADGSYSTQNSLVPNHTGII